MLKFVILRRWEARMMPQMSEEANIQSVDCLCIFQYFDLVGVKMNIVDYQSFAVCLGRRADGDMLVIWSPIACPRLSSRRFQCPKEDRDA